MDIESFSANLPSGDELAKLPEEARMAMLDALMRKVLAEVARRAVQEDHIAEVMRRPQDRLWRN